MKMEQLTKELLDKQPPEMQGFVQKQAEHIIQVSKKRKLTGDDLMQIAKESDELAAECAITEDIGNLGTKETKEKEPPKQIVTFLEILNKLMDNVEKSEEPDMNQISSFMIQMQKCPTLQDRLVYLGDRTELRKILNKLRENQLHPLSALGPMLETMLEASEICTEPELSKPTKKAKLEEIVKKGCDQAADAINGLNEGYESPIIHEMVKATDDRKAGKKTMTKEEMLDELMKKYPPRTRPIEPNYKQPRPHLKLRRN